MQARWTLPDLVEEVASQIGALPAPRNGQVRAVPDERTVRYYATIGLLDRPIEMRGRTALYGEKHIAQIVAIKRLQTMGRSLAEIQALWPTLDDPTLARMSGVAFTGPDPAAPRGKFWKLEPVPGAPMAPAAEAGADAPPVRTAQAVEDEPPGSTPRGAAPPPRAAPIAAAGGPGALELRVELAPHVVLSLSIVDDRIAISPADIRALRAAAAPLLAELAARRLTSHPGGQES